jgi:hypothetical protein
MTPAKPAILKQPPEGLRVLAAVQVQRHPRGGGGIFDIRALEPAAGL